MHNKIGVMQGRLLPKYKGRYQAHPVGYWQDEFRVAKELGLDHVEFILDFNNVEENPIIKKGGIDEIQLLSEQTGVTVKTICADYFMEAPLHSTNKIESELSQQIMTRLLNSSKELDITDVVVPCVDQSTLADQSALDRFVEKLMPMVALADRYEINISLETDLAPQPFAELLDRFDSNCVTVNYDIGNSAALGYDLIEELDAYGHKITDIHIKDRVLNGGSVVLGDGAADFNCFFNKIKEFNYQGPYIMQAYRDEDGIDIFKEQLKWITPFLNR